MMPCRAAPTSAKTIPVAAIISLLACGGMLPLSAANCAPNFLVIVGDDMGVETLASYGLNDNTAVTPTLDNLSETGIRFDNCGRSRYVADARDRDDGPLRFPNRSPGSPSRRRPGGEDRADKTRRGALRATQQPAGARAAAVGARAPVSTSSRYPWRSSPTRASATRLRRSVNGISPMRVTGYEKHPLRAGFDHFAGSAIGGLESYFAFSKQVDGEETEGSTVYSTTDKVNSAIDWLEGRDDDNPWFVWLSFNNPHSPYHLPPLELLHSDAKNLDPEAVAENPHAYFKAQLEALGHGGRQAARFADGGTARQHLRHLHGRQRYLARGTAASVPFGTRQGHGLSRGLNVPFMISGPGIEAGRTSDALLNTVDLYATFLELAGIDVENALPDDREFDSISFAPLLRDPHATPAREFAFADIFSPWRDPSRAIRNATHKLVDIVGTEELYNLVEDPYEHNDLLASDLSAEDLRQYDQLKAKMMALLASE